MSETLDRPASPWCSEALSADGLPILVARGELGPASVMGLLREVTHLLDQGHRSIVVDLRAAVLLGTPTLSLLCGASRCASRRGAKLALIGLTSADARVLDAFALDGVELHPTVAAAAFAAKGAGA